MKSISTILIIALSAFYAPAFGQLSASSKSVQEVAEKDRFATVRAHAKTVLDAIQHKNYARIWTLQQAARAGTDYPQPALHGKVDFFSQLLTDKGIPEPVAGTARSMKQIQDGSDHSSISYSTESVGRFTAHRLYYIVRYQARPGAKIYHQIRLGYRLNDQCEYGGKAGTDFFLDEVSLKEFKVGEQPPAKKAIHPLVEAQATSALNEKNLRGKWVMDSMYHVAADPATNNIVRYPVRKKDQPLAVRFNFDKEQVDAHLVDVTGQKNESYRWTLTGRVMEWGNTKGQGKSYLVESLEKKKLVLTEFPTESLGTVTSFVLVRK